MACHYTLLEILFFITLVYMIAGCSFTKPHLMLEEIYPRLRGDAKTRIAEEVITAEACTKFLLVIPYKSEYEYLDNVFKNFNKNDASICPVSC